MSHALLQIRDWYLVWICLNFSYWLIYFSLIVCFVVVGCFSGGFSGRGEGLFGFFFLISRPSPQGRVTNEFWAGCSVPYPAWIWKPQRTDITQALWTVCSSVWLTPAEYFPCVKLWLLPLNFLSCTSVKSVSVFLIFSS